MHYYKVDILNKYAYLIPIGDTHIGDKSFDEQQLAKLEGYVDWVKKEKWARVILMGDILNCATRQSVSSPFAQAYNLEGQIQMAGDIFKPIRKKIICAISGNHEERLADYCGYDPTISICEKLKIPYAGKSAVVEMSLWRKSRIEGFIVYAHHTTGGGRTAGGKLNRVEMLTDLFINADIYLGSHNHALFSYPRDTFYLAKSWNHIGRLRQFLIGCGGYLSWDSSYAERAMHPPLKTGSPKIKMEIITVGSTRQKTERKAYEKDVHVSL